MAGNHQDLRGLKQSGRQQRIPPSVHRPIRIPENPGRNRRSEAGEPAHTLKLAEHTEALRSSSSKRFSSVGGGEAPSHYLPLTYIYIYMCVWVLGIRCVGSNGNQNQTAIPTWDLTGQLGKKSQINWANEMKKQRARVCFRDPLPKEEGFGVPFGLPLKQLIKQATKDTQKHVQDPSKCVVFPQFRPEFRHSEELYYDFRASRTRRFGAFGAICPAISGF